MKGVLRSVEQLHGVKLESTSPRRALVSSACGFDDVAISSWLGWPHGRLSSGNASFTAKGCRPSRR